ncbi:MAG TPA: hypothetical protein VGZ02_00830 [Candidatus Baltobacteraceae bacterium]|nr:hypothetical protein [Candidatus Baltobacteraceae bacterium]
MKNFLPWIALAGVAVSLAACNNGAAAPGPPAPCGSPPGVSQTVLVYPAPGATGVPDSIGQVIVASNAAISNSGPNTWDIELEDGLGNGFLGNAFAPAPSPLPTPNQQPTFANPVFQTSTFTNVNIPGETLAVVLNNTASSCTPSVQVGTFTTQ